MKPLAGYPEWFACDGMPSVDGATVECRVQAGEDIVGPGTCFTVSIDVVVWVRMPVLQAPGMPSEVRQLFENYGIVLVRCRVVERQAGYVVVEVPSTDGVTRLSVLPGAMARRRLPGGGGGELTPDKEGHS